MKVKAKKNQKYSYDSINVKYIKKDEIFEIREEHFKMLENANLITSEIYNTEDKAMNSYENKSMSGNYRKRK